MLKSEIVGTLRSEDLSKKERIVAQAYRWKINESIAQIRLLYAIAKGDMRRFVRYSEFIWGSPSKEVFAYSLNLLRGKIEAAKLSENSDLVEAAAKLEKMLSFGVSGGEAIQAPSQEIFDFACAQTQAEFGSISVADKKN